jgi:hypothetical protein
VFSERETGEMVAASGVDGRQDVKGGQRGGARWPVGA